MNAPLTVLATQTEALLGRVAREEEQRTRRVREEAAEQARTIVVRARAEARQRLRQAVEEERRELARAIADRSAALDTEARRAEQAMLRSLIEGAWQRLPAAVAARWEDAPAREEWVRAACEFAVRSLRSHAAITVEIDPGNGRAAGEQARALLDAAGLDSVEVREVAGLGPGLRIASGGACVDATVGGILASRERVESELLAEFDRALGHTGMEKPA